MRVGHRLGSQGLKGDEQMSVVREDFQKSCEPC